MKAVTSSYGKEKKAGGDIADKIRELDLAILNRKLDEWASDMQDRETEIIVSCVRAIISEIKNKAVNFKQAYKTLRLSNQRYSEIYAGFTHFLRAYIEIQVPEEISVPAKYRRGPLNTRVFKIFQTIDCEKLLQHLSATLTVEDRERLRTVLSKDSPPNADEVAIVAASLGINEDDLAQLTSDDSIAHAIRKKLGELHIRWLYKEQSKSGRVARVQKEALVRKPFVPKPKRIFVKKVKHPKEYKGLRRLFNNINHYELLDALKRIKHTSADILGKVGALLESPNPPDRSALAVFLDALEKPELAELTVSRMMAGIKREIGTTLNVKHNSNSKKSPTPSSAASEAASGETAASET